MTTTWTATVPPNTFLEIQAAAVLGTMRPESRLPCGITPSMLLYTN